MQTDLRVEEDFEAVGVLKAEAKKTCFFCGLKRKVMKSVAFDSFD